MAQFHVYVAAINRAAQTLASCVPSTDSSSKRMLRLLAGCGPETCHDNVAYAVPQYNTQHKFTTTAQAKINMLLRCLLWPTVRRGPARQQMGPEQEHASRTVGSPQLISERHGEPLSATPIMRRCVRAQ